MKPERKNDKKLVIVCKALPPLIIGSPVLMTNLFSNYDGPIEALAGWEYGAKIDNNLKFPCQVHYLKFKLNIVQRILQRFANIYFIIIKFFLYRKLKAIRPAAVFGACTPDGLFFTAAYIVCKKLNIPFWGHMHDLWVENTRENTFYRRLAEKWEPIIMKNAERIFCMTDKQMDYYKEKYPRDYDFIPHCVKTTKVNKEQIIARLKEKQKRKEKKIIYTGNISSHMNLDAIKTFIKTIDLLPENYSITFFTSISEEGRKAEGIQHPRVNYGWVSVNEAFEAIKDADLLFLPLSFKNCSIEEVRTVFSTKTLDYLISGTPILTFSPPDSYHSEAAKKHGWGYVVSEDSATAIYEGINTLLNDNKLVEETVENALNEIEYRNSEIYCEKLSNFVNQL